MFLGLLVLAQVVIAVLLQVIAVLLQVIAVLRQVVIAVLLQAEERIQCVFPPSGTRPTSLIPAPLA